jgi:hypothetical protein
MEEYLQRSSVAQAVFNALCAHPYGLTADELVESVYGKCEDGGPLWAANSICVSCVHFNKRAEREGWSLRIRGTPGPGGRRQIWIVR